MFSVWNNPQKDIGMGRRWLPGAIVEEGGVWTENGGRLSGVGGKASCFNGGRRTDRFKCVGRQMVVKVDGQCPSAERGGEVQRSRPNADSS